jgi:pantetheine-phosphate adenylyltransferase
MTRAIYPGTFDPIHHGHIDIATRANEIFDELLLAIYDAPPKKLLFSTEDRVQLARTALAHLPNIEIISYRGLTVECARDVGATVMIRGLRNVADFEFEQQIGWANSHIAPDVELCCMFCNDNFAFLSATILKEIASLGGSVDSWAPDHVLEALQMKYPDAGEAHPTQVITKSEGKLTHHE